MPYMIPTWKMRSNAGLKIDVVAQAYFNGNQDALAKLRQARLENKLSECDKKGRLLDEAARKKK